MSLFLIGTQRIDNGMVSGAQRVLADYHAAADAAASRAQWLRAEFLKTLQRDPNAPVWTPVYSRVGQCKAVEELFVHMTDASMVVVAQILCNAAAQGDTLAQMVLESTALAYAECHCEAEE